MIRDSDKESMRKAMERGIKFLRFFEDSTSSTYEAEIRDTDHEFALKIRKGYMHVWIEPQPEHGQWVGTLFMEVNRMGRHTPPYDDVIDDVVKGTVIQVIGWALKKFYEERVHRVMQDFQAAEIWDQV